MGEGAILDLWRAALATLTMSAAPFVVSALIVGLAMALLQAATQLQENILTFIPKLIAVGAVLLVGGPWVLDRLVHYMTTAIESLTVLGAGAR